MKLLLDEMYAGLKEYFETLGWEAETAQEVGLKGAKDKDVVEYAQKHDLLLITQDPKPQNWLISEESSTCSSQTR